MPEEIPKSELQRMPNDMFNELARYLPAADLSSLLTTSKGMKDKVGAYLEKILSTGDIVATTNGLPVDRDVPWLKILTYLDRGDYQRNVGRDPKTSILDVVMNQGSHDQAEKFSQYIVICTYGLEQEASRFKAYALDAMERVDYTFTWFEDGKYLLTGDKDGNGEQGIFSHQEGETILDMARRWRVVSGVLAPLPGEDNNTRT
jgi:hypothetical protein